MFFTTKKIEPFCKSFACFFGSTIWNKMYKKNIKKYRQQFEKIPE